MPRPKAASNFRAREGEQDLIIGVGVFLFAKTNAHGNWCTAVFVNIPSQNGPALQPTCPCIQLTYPCRVGQSLPQSGRVLLKPDIVPRRTFAHGRAIAMDDGKLAVIIEPLMYLGVSVGER